MHANFVGTLIHRELTLNKFWKSAGAFIFHKEHLIKLKIEIIFRMCGLNKLICKIKSRQAAKV